MVDSQTLISLVSDSLENKIPLSVSFIQIIILQLNFVNNTAISGSRYY